jgi:hypothetical protein
MFVIVKKNRNKIIVLGSIEDTDMSNRTYLNVPFIRKTIAKELGAKWDKAKKSWYCEDDNEHYNDLLKEFGTKRFGASLDKNMPKKEKVKDDSTISRKEEDFLDVLSIVLKVPKDTDGCIGVIKEGIASMNMCDSQGMKRSMAIRFLGAAVILALREPIPMPREEENERKEENVEEYVDPGNDYDD